MRTSEKKKKKRHFRRIHYKIKKEFENLLISEFGVWYSFGRGLPTRLMHRHSKYWLRIGYFFQKNINTIIWWAIHSIFSFVSVVFFESPSTKDLIASVIGRNLGNTPENFCQSSLWKYSPWFFRQFNCKVAKTAKSNCMLKHWQKFLLLQSCNHSLL